jgi:glycosyltransferase involved in cell wall biosynthesis
MRVLYVLDELAGRTAGTEGQFLQLVTGVRARNADVRVTVLRGSAALQELGDIPTRILGLRSLASPRAGAALWRLAREARAAGADVAHVFFNDASIACPIPLRMAGIPVIVSRRDLGFWYTPAALWFLRMNRHAVSTVVANSIAVKREVVRQERYPENKVAVIHNGWPLRDVREDRAEVRSALGIPAAAKMLLIVANLRPLKRVDDAIRIAALALRGDPEVWLVVVGEDRRGAGGSERERLSVLARELQVADRVVFAGSSADPWPITSACDIGLLCSETEGLSNTLIEYSAAGKPAVCTRVGGNEEIVADEQSGYLYPIGNVEQGAARVAQLLRDPELRRRMGIVGRQLVASRFGIDEMLESHLRLYAALARGSTGRSAMSPIS